MVNLFANSYFHIQLQSNIIICVIWLKPEMTPLAQLCKMYIGSWLASKVTLSCIRLTVRRMWRFPISNCAHAAAQWRSSILKQQLGKHFYQWRRTLTLYTLESCSNSIVNFCIYIVGFLIYSDMLSFIVTNIYFKVDRYLFFEGHLTSLSFHGSSTQNPFSLFSDKVLFIFCTMPLQVVLTCLALLYYSLTCCRSRAAV